MRALKQMAKNVFDRGMSGGDGTETATINGHANHDAVSNDITFLTETSNTSHAPALYVNDENPDRGNWSGKIDFVLSMLGWSVGLGNIWRFPYLCYKNGGGVFLIPYFMSVIVIGIPFFYLEVNLGQFSSMGPLNCWQFAPIFKGIGVMMVVLSGILTIYYNILITYSLYFLFASFTSEVPWTHCDNYWNTPTCSLKIPVIPWANCTKPFLNGTCYNSTDSWVGVWNATVFKNITGEPRMSPSEEYWIHRVLNESDGIDNMGGIQWELFGILCLAWIICFLCLVKGIKTTGRVVYFTALFPYVVLIILFVNGMTLDGSEDGVYFFIQPKWEKLLTIEVWKDAITQVFYSIGMGWGGLIALASYNKFHNNSFRDSLLVPICGSLTSFFSGFVIFSYLGYMARWMNVGVKDVVSSGAGLAFIVYPEAITHLPAPPFWSITFFCMLLTVGLDSQFVTVETVLTGICDQWPSTRPKKSWIVAGICFVEFLLGIPLVTRGGFYLFMICDSFVGILALPIICLLEAIALAYVYGVNRFFRDIEIMTGRKSYTYVFNIFFKASWMVISPMLIVCLLVFSWINYGRLKYGTKYEFPQRYEVLGWFISITPVVFGLLMMAYKIYAEADGKTLWERIKLICQPSRMWGPYLVDHRRLVHYVPGFVLDPRQEREELKQETPTPIVFSPIPNLNRRSIEGSNVGIITDAQESVI